MPLFFDTETTGVPRNYRAPVSDLKNWPRMVQLAWLATDHQGNELAAAELIVRPEGFTIPADAARIHGITTERALAEGVPLAQAAEAFLAALQGADLLVGHNIEFDCNILGAEFLRLGGPNPLEGKKRRCTMQESTDWCRLPGPYGFKWPKLEELHRKLFGQPFEGAHTALADVRACARCYVELQRLGVMK